MNRDDIERVQDMLKGCNLYLPNSTYSWLSRSKLIKVRNHTVSYTLMRWAVQEGKIYPVRLPELYDEIARRMMFLVDRKIPLTDFRALILSTYLQAPLLTFDDRLLKRLAEHVDVQEIGNIKGHWSLAAASKILELYRNLVLDFGDRLYEMIEKENTFSNVPGEILKTQKKNLEVTAGTIQKIDKKQSNPGTLNFRYLVWNLLPVIREYVDQHVLRSKVVRELCRRSFLLLASFERSQDDR